MGWENSYYEILSCAPDGTLNSGALGGKFNGSGGGGCMFAYSPNNPEKVATAIERVGGKAYIIHPDVGARIE